MAKSLSPSHNLLQFFWTWIMSHIYFANTLLLCLDQSHAACMNKLQSQLITSVLCLDTISQHCCSNMIEIRLLRIFMTIQLTKKKTQLFWTIVIMWLQYMDVNLMEFLFINVILQSLYTSFFHYLQFQFSEYQHSFGTNSNVLSQGIHM